MEQTLPPQLVWIIGIISTITSIALPAWILYSKYRMDRKSKELEHRKAEYEQDKHENDDTMSQMQNIINVMRDETTKILEERKTAHQEDIAELNKRLDSQEQKINLLVVKEHECQILAAKQGEQLLYQGQKLIQQEGQIATQGHQIVTLEEQLKALRTKPTKAQS